jgi:hypothetical protein
LRAETTTSRTCRDEREEKDADEESETSAGGGRSADDECVGQLEGSHGAVRKSGRHTSAFHRHLPSNEASLIFIFFFFFQPPIFCTHPTEIGYTGRRLIAGQSKQIECGSAEVVTWACFTIRSLSSFRNHSNRLILLLFISIIMIIPAQRHQRHNVEQQIEQSSR